MRSLLKTENELIVYFDIGKDIFMNVDVVGMVVSFNDVIILVQYCVIGYLAFVCFCDSFNAYFYWIYVHSYNRKIPRIILERKNTYVHMKLKLKII